MPKVSVIMLSYNHERYIKEAIESVLNQSYHDYELIVVDDGSSDNSLNIINSFDDNRMRVYANQVNLGACFALNYGISLSVGDYIAAAGGIDIDTASKRRIYLVDQDYNKTRVNLTTELEPGSVIYVDKKWLDRSKDTLTKVLIFTTFTAALLGIVVSIVSLAEKWNDWQDSRNN